MNRSRSARRSARRTTGRTARRTAAALLPLALFAATACSSGAAGDVADAADSVGRSGGASAPAGGGSATPTPTRTGGGFTAESPKSVQIAYLSSDQLETALVPDSALPDGWTVIGGDRGSDDRSDGGDTYDKPECATVTELLAPGKAKTVSAKGKASVVAMDPAGGGKAYAIVGANLASFAAGDAEKLLAKTRELIPRCTQMLITSEGGVTIQARIAAEKAPELGDESLALSQTSRTANGQVFVHGIVAVRVGTTIVESTYVNLTGDEVMLPDEELVRMQVERVQAVLDGRTPRD
ncbi:hypothetical protein OG216_28675 [Streptomycetaceae bacterium NBC_01309]